MNSMKQILFSGMIGLFLTLIGTPLLIKLLAKKGYGQFIRDDGPRTHGSTAAPPNTPSPHRSKTPMRRCAGCTNTPPSWASTPTASV